MIKYPENFLFSSHTLETLAFISKYSVVTKPKRSLISSSVVLFSTLHVPLLLFHFFPLVQLFFPIVQPEPIQECCDWAEGISAILNWQFLSILLSMWILILALVFHFLTHDFSIGASSMIVVWILAVVVAYFLCSSKVSTEPSKLADNSNCCTQQWNNYNCLALWFTWYFWEWMMNGRCFIFLLYIYPRALLLLVYMQQIVLKVDDAAIIQHLCC